MAGGAACTVRLPQLFQEARVDLRDRAIHRFLEYWPSGPLPSMRRPRQNP